MFSDHSNILQLCLILPLLALPCGSLLADTNLPPHPRLLLNRQGLAHMKARINDSDWAREQWAAVKAKADELLRKPVVLPPRGGNWYHWYACPEHGARFVTGKRIGEWTWEHICPVDKKVFKGDRSQPKTDYDGCVISSVHGGWSKAVLDLGLAYQVTGKKDYASKAREILLAYADRYLTYPLHNVHGEPKLGGGRVGPQTLDEAVWLIPICQGTDLIWDTLSEADRGAIREKLLLPAAKDVILPHNLGLSNIQAWKNSAVGLVGFLLGDRSLIDAAIDDPKSGFRMQMKKAVLPDGGWWEGAWGYHFYTMSALWSLAEAARNCGIDLYGEELKSMFDAPLRFAMPDLKLPAFNDSGEVNLKASAGIYELGYARYHDPAYLALLDDSPRKNDYALWFGVRELPPTTSSKHKSSNYPRAGYAILSRGKGGEATWLCLKYGPHGGGHGHPDKLSFVLYSHGETLGVDPGTCLYGLPVHQGWYKTTLAHNTLTVDGESQKPAEGKCIDFGTDKGVDFAVVEAGDVYDGVHFTRTAALLNENLLVFIDQISSDSEHTYDIVYHQRGKWDDVPFGSSWTPPDKPGYRYLTEGKIRNLSSGAVLSIGSEDGPSTVVSPAGGEPTEVITALGIGADSEDKVPVCIFRRKASRTAIVWSISLDGRPVKLDYLTASSKAGGSVDRSDVCAVRVTGADGKTWTLAANPERRPVSVSLPDGSMWQTDGAFSIH